MPLLSQCPLGHCVFVRWRLDQPSSSGAPGSAILVMWPRDLLSSSSFFLLILSFVVLLRRSGGHLEPIKGYARQNARKICDAMGILCFCLYEPLLQDAPRLFFRVMCFFPPMMLSVTLAPPPTKALGSSGYRGQWCCGVRRPT